MSTFLPSSWLDKVDFPAFGAPIMATFKTFGSAGWFGFFTSNDICSPETIGRVVGTVCNSNCDRPCQTCLFDERAVNGYPVRGVWNACSVTLPCCFQRQCSDDYRCRAELRLDSDQGCHLSPSLCFSTVSSETHPIQENRQEWSGKRPRHSSVLGGSCILLKEKHLDRSD